MISGSRPYLPDVLPAGLPISRIRQKIDAALLTRIDTALQIIRDLLAQRWAERPYYAEWLGDHHVAVWLGKAVEVRKIGKMQVQIDLGAERLIAAEKGTERIAIEIKTFGGLSFITALYEAVGKYIIYRNVLRRTQPDRLLFLALPESIFDRFFEESVIRDTVQEENINLVLYNQTDKLITRWIK